MLMVELVVVGMMRGDGAAAKDILDEERRPAGGSSVLAWLSLLLLAGRLHLFSFGATLRLRRARLHPGVLARLRGREIGCEPRSSVRVIPTRVRRRGGKTPRRGDLAGNSLSKPVTLFPAYVSANRTSLEFHPPTESRLIAADLATDRIWIVRDAVCRSLSFTVVHRAVV